MILLHAHLVSRRRLFHRRGLVFLCSLLVALLLLSGCASRASSPGAPLQSGPSPESQAGPQAKAPPLRVVYSEWPGDYPLILARELGLYQKYGVEVDLSYNQYYRDALTRYTAGSLDVFGATLGDAIRLGAQRRSRLVAALDSSDGADAIVGTVLVRQPADLKGRRLGVNLGSIMGEMFIADALHSAGLSESDVELVNAAPEMVPNMMGYMLDAGHTWQPYTARAVANGYPIIYTSAETPDRYPDVIVLDPHLLETRPDQVRGFLRAVLEAADYWNANPQEAAALLAGAYGRSTTPISTDGVRLYGVAANRQLFTPGSDFSSIFYTYQHTLQYMIDHGYLSTRPDPASLVDPSYLP